MKLSSVRLDESRVDDGVWFETSYGLRLRVAKNSNREFQREWEDFLRRRRSEHARRNGAGKAKRAGDDFEDDFSSHVRDPEVVAIVSRHILKDWEADADADPVRPEDREDGKTYRELDDGTMQETIPYTPDRGAAVLSDPGYEHVYRDVLGFSSEGETTWFERREAELGN